MGDCTLVSSWYYIVSTDFTTLFNVPRIVPLTLDYIAKEETLPAPYFLDKHPEWENPCFDRPILFVAHADPYLPSRASSDILNPSLLCWTLPPSLLTFESPQLFFFLIDKHRNKKEASSWLQRASIQPVHQPHIDDCVF